MSKKLLTGVLALLMGAGLVMQPAVAYAAEFDEFEEEILLEEATVITNAHINSNYKEIAVKGNVTETPEVEILDNDMIVIEPFWISSKDEKSWNFCREDDTFMVGYHYRFYLLVDVAEQFADKYRLDPNFTLYINDEPNFTMFPASEDEELVIATDSIFISESDVPKPVEKTIISSISVTSDYEDICKKGEPIRDISFELTEELPVELSGGWFTDVGGDIWATPTDKFFTSGKYQYEVEVKVLDENADDYELDKNLTLTVNGKEWTRHKSKDDDYTIITFESEIIDLTNDQIIIVTQTKATSDFESIPKFGEPIKMPDFVLIEGKEVTIEGEWYKQIGGMWSQITDKIFTPGTYRFEADVRISDEYADTHELDRFYSLTVNNVPWTRLLSFAGFDNSFTFISDEFIISEEIPIIEEGRWYTKYGKTYYEYPSGEKAVGMQFIEDDYYLFSKKGVLQKNVFFEDDGLKFYFGSDGKLVKGWIKKWTATYYADEEGVIQTGFVDIDGDTYYFDAKGKQKSSVWISQDGDRYYIKADGHMAKSETISRWGKKYTFDENGRLMK